MQVDQISDYSPPLNQLLTYGEAGSRMPDTWPNYLEMGIGPEHIPDLIRMAADEKLNDADVGDVWGWAPMHAYRALAQLRAEVAIEPLLSLLELFHDINDFAMEELPYVLAMFGPVTLPKIAEFLADSSRNEWAHVGAIEGVAKIGLSWPETRSECVALLMARLELFDDNDYNVNTFLIDALTDLDAVEAAPLIEQAYAADSVEEFVIGDWDDVQVRLGLKSEEEVKEKRAREREEERRRRRAGEWDLDGPGVTLLPGYERYERTSTSTEQVRTSTESVQTSLQVSHKTNRPSEATRKKAKSKMAKQSRKKNRKR